MKMLDYAGGYDYNVVYCYKKYSEVKYVFL